MHHKFVKPVLIGLIPLILILVLSLSALQPAQSASLPIQTTISVDEPVSEVIKQYRALIPDLINQKKIPGLAIALVDDGQVLWSEGFGYTDWDRSTAVTADTPFSIQSISKSFTAAVVMLAIQEGLVDLDTPLSSYLPDFKVNSIFEENPADKITIRHLLSHTAGFTHEAPLGNNYHSNVATFEDHVTSIQQTWLKFPVGQGYSYSNLGIDLAAYLVQAQSGIPFPQFAQEKLFKPLGMVNSSYDLSVIQNNPNKAIGHGSIMEEIPLSPLLASGGLYTTVNDMAKFLQLLSNNGKVAGVEILNKDLIDTMSTHHFVASKAEYYGLGIGVGRGFNTLELNHGGGGFGFLSMMTFYPELELGLVWLTNSSDHDLQSYFSNEIFNEVIVSGLATYKQRVYENPVTSTKTFGADDVKPLSGSQLEDAIRNLSLQTTPESLNRWKAYSGPYFSTSFGRKNDFWLIRQKENSLEINGQILFEVQPGLFFTAEGEALDMRGEIPTFRSIELEKVKLPGLVLGFWILCAVSLIATIGWVLVSAIQRMVNRRKAGTVSYRMTLADLLLRWCLVLGSIWGLVLAAAYYLFPILLVDRFPSAFNPNLFLWQKMVLAAPIGVFILGLTAAVLWVLWQKSQGKGFLPIRVEFLFPMMMIVFALVSYF